MREPNVERPLTIVAGNVVLSGDLTLPKGAEGLVVFVHGSGSSRFSSRNRHVAAVFAEAGLATLLMDLLTASEEVEDERTGRLRFNIPLLADWVVATLDWLGTETELAGLRVGCFGASTGAAAALIAAAQRPARVHAVVSRGGRPDLAGEHLQSVRAPALLIVGGADLVVLELNESAYRELRCVKRLAVVAGATHLFEEPGALDRVALLAREWFSRHLSGSPSPNGSTRTTGSRETRTTLN